MPESLITGDIFPSESSVTRAFAILGGGRREL